MQSNPTETEPTGPLQSTALTPRQESQWGDTVSMMAWTCPGFRHLWYRMLAKSHNAGGSKYVAVMSTSVPIAATDGQNLILNPDKFFQFGLSERVFIAAHEIVHNVYGDVELLHRCQASGTVPMHDGSSLPFDNGTMQKAMDLRINALLLASKIGKTPTLNGESVGHFDEKMTGHESVLDVYAQHYKKKPDNDGNEPGQGDNPGGFDSLLPPGKSSGQNPAQAAQQRNPSQWAVETAAAQTIEQIKSQGKMAAALKRMFKELLEPEVPWTDHIETLINRAVGGGGHAWNHPDEWFIGRDIYQPHKTGKGAGWIVVWGDTSGSRDDKELASNMAELAAILDDVHPQRLTVLWCDAAIDYVDEIEDPMDLQTIHARGTGGGGGTSVQPVFDWIKDHFETPDLFIGFTDGYVSFPREPNFPVIWASSTDHVYPYGQTVRVNQVVIP